MRQGQRFAMVVVVFFAGCAASRGVVRYMVPPARAATPLQRWEYDCKDVFTEHANDLTDELTNAANQYGRQGWQVSQLAYHAGSERNAMVCFERALP